MPAALGMSLSPADGVTLALAMVLVVLVAIIGYRAWKQSQVTPQERERRRRAVLVAQGKMGDATLLEIRDDMILYSYAVRGVEYTASQDVSTLKEHIPGDLSTVGPVSVKYAARNPANSIVIAEEWSGIRFIRAS